MKQSMEWRERIIGGPHFRRTSVYVRYVGPVERLRGATGIRAMIRWAKTARGGDFDDGTGLDCAYGSAGCGT